MLISLILLAAAAVLLLASDHLAQARLNRPPVGRTGPAPAAPARWENEGSTCARTGPDIQPAQAP